jgi:two-component system OmpR family sensor kinase
VLAALGVVGYLLVRRSLRPLRQVEATAAAITAGDLTERVPGTDPRTEVGSVATALNTMLAQVESSFSESERAKAEAVTAEVRMRRFLADASHELRTPLTSIRGWAELYRRGGTREPAAVERSMTRIEQEATRMGLLVEDMLLLARLDEHRPMARAPVDLLVLAADAVTDAAAVDPGRPVELREPHDAVVVLGDEARLRQVVVNLVGNALVHTPEGTRVVVGVDARPQDGDPPATLQQWAVLEVADEGPGLSAEESERVFERFYRADPARSRSRGGTGLGLSIVAAVVAAHGGRVDVESTPGAGSRFRVWLPLAEDKGREVREP